MNYRKIKFLYLTAVLLMFCSAGLKAQSVLSCSDTAVVKGDSLTLRISYSNYQDIIGYQFDVSLPASFTYLGYTAASGRYTGHQIIVSKVNETTIRVLCFSMQNSPLTNKITALINISLKTDAEAGKYPVEIKNVSLVGTSGKNILDSVKNGNITVGSLSRTEQSSELNPWQKPELKIFPNPFNNSTKYACLPVGTQSVKIQVLNIQGRCLFQEEIYPKAPGWNYGTIKMDKYPSGIYLVRMVQNDFSTTQKIFLLK